jgi:hypothetical protein
MAQKGWLWMIWCIGILIVIWAAIRGPLGTASEPFQDLNYKTLNVSYDKEVYVIKGNYTTQADAATACKNSGAELATLEQIKRAQDASANWCTIMDRSPAAWISDSTTDLYYPSASCSTTDPCEDGTTGNTCLRKKSATTAGNKYAACYGTKPAEKDAYLIDYFNPLNYSIFDTDLLTRTMNGTKADESTMGLVFTPSQALYALDQTYDRTNTSRYSHTRARERLVNNMATINTTIRNDVEPSTITNENLAEWANGRQKTCSTLGELQTALTAKVQQVKLLIDKVNAYTNGAINAKNENIDMQQEVAYVCRGMSADTSPACKRLAEIDYEVYFKGVTGGDTPKVLADLENLNMLLYSRQCEIRVAARQIQILSRALSCEQQGFQYDAATLGQNFIQALGEFYPIDPSDPCADLSGNSQYQSFKPYFAADTRFTAGKSVPYVDSERLKLSLEQLSPYFNEPGYGALFQQILDSLSFLLRIPSLNDYSNSFTNFRDIQKSIESVTNFMPSIWGST